MNYLLFNNSEVETVNNCTLITVSGVRGCYIRDRHQLTKAGTCVKAGICAGKLGSATLLTVSDLETTNPTYTFEGKFEHQPPKKSNISLIVGVPRPQTVKKVIQLAVSYGIQNILFIRMEKTIPSYCESKVWGPDSIQNEIWQSLEQVGDTMMPNVILNKEANYFARSNFSKEILKFDNVIACDGSWTKPLSSLISLNDSERKNFAMILGPEAGFSDRERQWINDSINIQKVGLGERILRLEHAVGAALAIITSRSSI